MEVRDAVHVLADHVANVRYEDLSEAALAASKTFILDTFGVAIAGTTGPFVEEMIQAARGWGDNTTSTVFGSDILLPAPSAALINAYQAHNSEFDAIHERAVIHPLASILGAALSIAERDGGLSGRDLLVAATVGVDVSCSIGMGATEALRFFRPATAGSFGAVAALGKLAGFDRDRLIAALGLQLGQIGGTMQAHEEGSPLLGMQLGFCTRSAVTSFDLAAQGLSGPRGVLEGSHGYYALFEGGYEVSRALEGLGRDWRICGVSHKPFPSGRATHGAIDGLLQLREAHDIKAPMVEHVRVEVPPLVHQLTGRPMIDDPGVNYARLCIPYVGAVALARGNVVLEDFQSDRLRDPEMLKLAGRFAVDIRDVGDPNALVPQRVSVRLTDGREVAADLSNVIGSPANPLSRERHLTKFRRNWVSGRTPLDPEIGEQLITMVDVLETVDDCRALTATMVAD